MPANKKDSLGMEVECPVNMYTAVCKDEFRDIKDLIEKRDKETKDILKAQDKVLRGNGEPGVMSRLQALERIAVDNRTKIEEARETAESIVEKAREDAAATVIEAKNKAEAKLNAEEVERKKRRDEEDEDRANNKKDTHAKLKGVLFQVVSTLATSIALLVFGWLTGLLRTNYQMEKMVRASVVSSEATQPAKP